ncbi:MAG: tRNA epoxyqueuosine(34) reductase QueG [Capsulimonadaceae bacterium]
MSTGTTSRPALPDVPAFPDVLAARIKTWALELGFAHCGITSADPPPHHDSYRKWLELGYAGEMAYLARQEPVRANPAVIVAGASSVVCLAMNYAPSDGMFDATPADAEPGSPVGVIARYARFDDYHPFMWQRLNDLLGRIRLECPEVDGRAYCDTGPVTERDLAMRAGIGWIGKHTNLISQRLGNWFFLGQIILDIALPIDPPARPHCGTCRRCLPACPTGAIVAPYELDARRCISYLTIECKGSIPIELRPLIGNRIFGCDDCLAVCPWNKFARAASAPELRPHPELGAPDLIPLLSLDDSAFRARFRNSPIRRTKRRGFLRNVCVALGNIGDPRAVPVLERAAETDPEPLVREHALWALGRLANSGD